MRTVWEVTCATGYCCQTVATVQHVTREDWLNEEVKEQINRFDQAVDERLDDANFVIDDPNLTNYYIDDEDPNDELVPNMVVPDDAEYDDMLLDDRTERDDLTEELIDKYIGTETGSWRWARK